MQPREITIVSRYCHPILPALVERRQLETTDDFFAPPAQCCTEIEATYLKAVGQRPKLKTQEFIRHVDVVRQNKWRRDPDLSHRK